MESSWIMSWMIQAGIAVLIGGLFALAWFCFSRPVRLASSKSRVTPKLPAESGSRSEAGVDLSRRAPRL